MLLAGSLRGADEIFGELLTEHNGKKRVAVTDERIGIVGAVVQDKADLLLVRVVLHLREEKKPMVRLKMSAQPGVKVTSAGGQNGVPV